MATARTTVGKLSRGNGKDQKAIAARAAKHELHTAQDAAETFISSVISSANHFGEQIARTVSDTVSDVKRNAKGVQHKVQDGVRYRPLLALGVAAGAGLLLALMTRR